MHPLTSACRYEHGQQYRAHFDVNDSPERLALMRQRGTLGGMRTATLLMYLSGEWRAVHRSASRCSTAQCSTVHDCLATTAAAPGTDTGRVPGSVAFGLHVLHLGLES